MTKLKKKIFYMQHGSGISINRNHSKPIDLENLPAVCMTDSSICGGFLMADIDCPLNNEKGCIFRDWVLVEDIS